MRILWVAALSLAACSSSDPAAGVVQQYAENLGRNYADEVPKLEALQAAVDAFVAAPSAEGLAAELQEALSSDALFQRWRAQQDDPDAVDPALGATDPGASVQGALHNLHVELVVTTSLSGNLLKQRLRWLAGGHWELRDVSAA